MSRLDPAVGIIEVDSVAVGIEMADAMVKASPVGSLAAGTVHPGRYLVLVSGDTASVEVALDTGRAVGAAVLRDTIMLADIHPDVVAALISRAHGAPADGDAVAIVETSTVPTVIEAADAGVKAAHVTLPTIQLADGLGGKGYLVFSGEQADVEAAAEAAADRAAPTGHLISHVVIPQLHPEMAANLASDLRFNGRVALRPQERDG